MKCHSLASCAPGRPQAAVQEGNPLSQVCPARAAESSSVGCRAHSWQGRKVPRRKPEVVRGSQIPSTCPALQEHKPWGVDPRPQQQRIQPASKHWDNSPWNPGNSAVCCNRRSNPPKSIKKQSPYGTCPHFSRRKTSKCTQHYQNCKT